MFILQGSGLLGSDPTGPGSGYSLMARIFGKTALNVGMADPGTTEKGRV